MHYQSDWPEVGLPAALAAEGVGTALPVADRPETRILEMGDAAMTIRWVMTPEPFESHLYGMPHWRLHCEIEDNGSRMLAAGLGQAVLKERIAEAAERLLAAPPWSSGYISARVVPGEPLYRTLVKAGFDPVERRRLYTCQVRELAASIPSCIATAIQFTALGALDPAAQADCREQMLDICRETFGMRGYSRHYVDPALTRIQPGLAYTLAVMKRNFERVPAEQSLLAIQWDRGQVCGFTIAGKKPGLDGNRYTQLLSAVRKAYQGRGIYQGLTHLLAETLPPDSILLSVVQAENQAIQRAYQGSGRTHLADTVILRRVEG